MLARRLSYHSCWRLLTKKSSWLFSLVPLTFKDTESCDEVIQRGLSFGETPIHVSYADAKVRSVLLQDLPAEV